MNEGSQVLTIIFTDEVVQGAYLSVFESRGLWNKAFQRGKALAAHKPLQVLRDLHLMQYFITQNIKDSRCPTSDGAFEEAKYKAEFRGHDGPISSLVAANGLLCSGGADNDIRVWDLGRMEEKVTFSGHKRFVTCLVVYGTKVISGSCDRSI